MSWTGYKKKLSRKTLKAAECLNKIHQIINTNVRYCSSCGEVVNKRVDKLTCEKAAHERKRDKEINFCSKCGKSLLT